jgi:hypothetical protein
MERIPLVGELRAEASRLVAAAGKDSPIFEQIERVERDLRFLLAIANFASDTFLLTIVPIRL